MPWGAIASVAGSVLSGAFSKKSSGQAAQAQNISIDQAIAEIQRQYGVTRDVAMQMYQQARGDTTGLYQQSRSDITGGYTQGRADQSGAYQQARIDQAPFVSTGVAANQQLAMLLGLPPPTQARGPVTTPTAAPELGSAPAPAPSSAPATSPIFRTLSTTPGSAQLTAPAPLAPVDTAPYEPTDAEVRARVSKEKDVAPEGGKTGRYYDNTDQNAIASQEAYYRQILKSENYQKAKDQYDQQNAAYQKALADQQQQTDTNASTLPSPFPAQAAQQQQTGPQQTDEEPAAPPVDYSSNPAFGALTRNFTPADLASDPTLLTRNFTADDLNSDVVYQSGLKFGLDQGTAAINARAIAGGGYDSGATLKALTRYGNDYGSTKANEAYNRYMANRASVYGQQSDAYNRFLQNRSSIYGMLSGTAGAGQGATNVLTNAGQNTANVLTGSAQNAANALTGASQGTAGNLTAQSLGTGNTIGSAGSAAANSVADLITQGGNARAAGIVGGANAWNSAAGGVNSAVNNYTNNQTLQQLIRNQNAGNYNNSYTPYTPNYSTYYNVAYGPSGYNYDDKSDY